MPIKERTTIVAGPKYSVELETINVDKRRWKPSCNKAPSSVLTTNKVVRTSPNAEDDWVSMAERINYGVSDFKRFNHCYHVHSLSDGGPMKLNFLNTTVVVTEEDEADWPDLSCSNSNYIWREVTDSKTLRLVVGNYLGNALDMGSIDRDVFISSTTALAKINDLARLAIEEMTPRLDDGWSLPVFIGDLLELKSLIRSAKPLMDVITDIAYAAIGGGTIKDISKSYLAHQFGLVPLIGDIKTIIRKYNTADNAVFDFLNNEGKDMTLHFEKKLDPLDFQVQSTFDPQPIVAEFEQKSIGMPWNFAKGVLPTGFAISGESQMTISNLEYHATMRFRYRLPNYSAAMKAFLASLDLYGANLSISDIWELVPFSFLVDWVVDVGTWLEGLDLENLPVTLEISDFCDSIKYIRTDEVRITDVIPSSWQPLGSTFSRTKECYYRWTGIPPAALTGPVFEDFKSTTGLSGWRVSILASLVGARSRFYF